MFFSDESRGLVPDQNTLSAFFSRDVWTCGGICRIEMDLLLGLFAQSSLHDLLAIGPGRCLDRPGDRLTAADAETRHAASASDPLQGIEQRDQDASPTASDGVAQSHG